MGHVGGHQVGGHVGGYFGILMQLLRDRPGFMEEINRGIKLERKIIALLVSSSILFTVYGAVIGSFTGGLQILASAVKLPALYLITLVICLPTLYFFNILFGSNRSFAQHFALLLASVSLISLLLCSFAPITLFFRLSVLDYQFFKLLNVVIFAITGLIGVNAFYQSMKQPPELESQADDKTRQKILQLWLVLYGFVGSQMGWILRPFFGAPNKNFELFRNLEGNIYSHVLDTMKHVFGF
ncbi:MAG: actin-binding WH2 domain-containing protein [Trichocoleus desertorum ATA4-8-CV12]|jgi:hypothetical protein|nr:actin-binding WH2 domain-containing protein [Trichocoleus desertorum ATA4-8-CV12]